jgi:TP901 family phage tail tape measure protein
VAKKLVLKAILRGEDELSRPWGVALKRAERQAGRSFTRIERMGLRAQRGFLRTGAAIGKGYRLANRGARAATGALGTFTKTLGGTAGAAALAVDQFGRYEMEVARLGNLLPKGSDAVGDFAGQIKGLAVQFGTDPIEAARAAYMSFSGGVEASKASLGSFLPVALKAAKAGFTEPAIAVDALTSVLNTYKDAGLDAAAVSDKLFVTEALGKTDFGQIAANIGQVAAFGRDMGLSFDEILAPMAALTKTGLSTSAAFTQLESLLAGITAPSGQAAAALKQLEIPFGPQAIKQAGGIVPLLKRIQEVTGKVGKGAIQQIFGRKEAQKAAFTLTSTGLADVIATLDGLGNATGRTETNIENLQRTTGFRIQQMKTGFKALVGELGGGIAEGLGLDKIENIPEAVDRAGKKMRSGAQNFAAGFLRAASGGKELSDIDWDRFGQNAGRVLGKLTKAAITFADGLVTWGSKVVDLVGGIAGFLTGDDEPAEAAARAGAGVTAFGEGEGVRASIFGERMFDPETGEETTAMAQGFGLLGGAPITRREREERRIIAGGNVLLSPEQLQAEIAAREARQSAERRRTGAAGFMSRPLSVPNVGGRQFSALPDYAFLAKQSGLGGALSPVGGKGEIVIKNEVKIKGGAADVTQDVKAKGAPSGTKLKVAPTGKRKTGGA